MVRLIALTVLAVLSCRGTASAVEKIVLDDKHDDARRVSEVWDRPAVKKFAAELDEVKEDLLRKDKDQLRRIFGAANDVDLAAFALPLAQPRMIALPGLRLDDDVETTTDVYLAGDFAAVKIWYLTDRKQPVALVVYFKTDKAFPRLTADNLDERLAWDQKRFDRLARFVAGGQPEKAQARRAKPE